MGLFAGASRSTRAPRDNDAIDAVRGDDAPFRSLQRTPGNTRTPRKARPVLDGNLDAPPPLDPAETAKTRARRRLIGAVALGLAAVVFVPMLFDRTPVSTADDIAIQIPDRDTPFEGRRGVPDTGRPLSASSAAPNVNAAPAAPSTPGPAPAAPDATTPGAGPTADATVADDPARADTPSGKSADRLVPPDAAARSSVPKTVLPAIVEKSTAKAPDKVVDASTAKATGVEADDPKALAALEGKESGTETAAGRGYAVQIAAFSATEKAHALRDRLVANGLRSYTESVSTTQGLRTRVRLGPFPSRDAADHAKQKLKTMKLDGSVVPL